jgi:cytochrome d ubiquinol oxidase subunit I
MIIDTTLLSRTQFGFTIGYHILFPALNIGLAIFLTCMEALWLKTHNPVYLTICKFWTKIFALTFGMGVVSGIVMSYELGTSFGPFILAVGGVLGSLFAYEVLSAFFLEAGFLDVMLFGWNKVGPNYIFVPPCL